MITLGISGLAHDAAVAIVRDGKILFALENDRVTRRKGEWSFPNHALAVALAACDLTPGDIDQIAFYWDDRSALLPAITEELRGLFDRRRPTLARIWRRCEAARSHRLLHAELGRIWQGEPVPPVRFVDHHLAHALYAYRTSGFAKALAVVIDGRGEFASLTSYLCEGDAIRRCSRVAMPASLGFVYGAVTQHLGFTPISDEYRVMGLAPYGRPDAKLDDFFARMIRFTADGFGVNLQFTRYQYSEALSARWLSDAVVPALGPPRDRGDPIEQRHADIAHALQARFEAVVLHILARLAEGAPGLPLTLAGGCAMNSVCNGRIARECAFPDFHLPAAPGDQGAAIGAAFAAFRQEQTAAHIGTNRSALLGPSYSQTQVLEAIRAAGFTPCSGTAQRDEAADLLCAGQVGGIFFGSLEFGSRALGGRSILADPRSDSMKERVNAKIKLRENFRPFGAIMLQDATTDYFGQEWPSEYMNIVMPIREQKRTAIPAVTHIDGSCRYQTVDAESQAPVADILRRFHARTDVPVLLNTSFNINGEPIVMTPQDAIDCYRTTDLDFLLIEDILLRKKATAAAPRGPM